MEKILLTISLFYILYSHDQVSAFPKRTTEFFVLRYLEDRRVIPVRVELNTELKTEYVSSIGGETLYDFNQGKVAYKDINSSQCFIADIVEESLERDRRRLENLRSGVIRGFHLATFTIQEELNRDEDILNKFGIILAKFCNGNTVSLVSRQKHRRKRQAPEEKGQFTHHSYGHYGHQTNDYAHYGHETYITGSVDKNGQIRNQRVSQHQVRSEGSQVQPRNGFRNGPQVSRRDFEMRVSSPQFQTQSQIPTHQQTVTGNGRNLGSGGSGQFSLQSTHEGGYQLNLPLGLQAGNTYQGGVRSSGHYGVGGLQPQITTEYQRYPQSIDSVAQQQTRLEQPSPPIVPGYRDIGRPKLDRRIPGISRPGFEKIPAHIQSGISAPAATGDQRLLTPAVAPGTHISGRETGLRTFMTPDQGQPGIDYSPDRKLLDERIIPSSHLIPRGTDLELPPTSLHPGESISTPGAYYPSYHPGISMPSVQEIGRGIQSLSGIPGQISTGIPGQISTGIPGQVSSGIPGQISTGIPGTQTIIPGLHPSPSVSTPGLHVPTYTPGTSLPSIHMPGQTIQRPGQTLQRPGHILTTVPGAEAVQPVTGISRPSYQLPSLPSMHPDLRHQQQYFPSGVISDRHHLQTPSTRYPEGYEIHRGTETRPQIHHPPPPGHTHFSGRDIPGTAQISSPTQAISGLQHPIPPRSDATIRNGIQYPDSSYPQTHTSTGEEYLRGAPHIPGIPDYSRSPPVTHSRDPYLLQRGTGPISPESIGDASRQTQRIPDSLHDLSGSSGRTASGLSPPSDGRITTSQTRPESSRLFGQDSASSQTQIQTSFERTAAEASAAGKFRGLGSQTQVQGGYAGNGSFSAQAQSGFTGGVVQSQVQGNKQGGLSGSSAQIEQVGSAQSQVQVGQPSGSASSTAQGRFTGGITQVQAQGSKSSGSAGAQSQSTGLSSSHVQVDIGGKDANEQERFQGTVSASVLGGHSSGQSQTQLQGGYESGRNYVATAQGGFDSTLGFQGHGQPVGTLTSLSNQTIAGRQFSAVNGQRPLQERIQPPRPGFPGYGSPPESGIINGRQTSQARDQIGRGSSIYTDHSGLLPDGKQFQTGLPQHQLPSPGITPQLISPTLHTADSRTQHPIRETQSHLIPSPQSAHRYPYSGYQPDSQGFPTDGRLLHTRPELPGYGRYDQRTVLPSSIIPSSQQPSELEILKQKDRSMQPAAFLPGTTGFQTGTQESHLSSPGLRQPTSPHDLAYPQFAIPTPARSTDQQYNYTAGIPVRYPDLISQPTGIGSQLQPGLTIPSLQSQLQPGLSIPSLQPQLQPGISMSSLQLQPGLTMHQIPGQQEPSLQPGLTMHQIPGQQEPSIQPGLTMPQSPGLQPQIPIRHPQQPSLITDQPQISLPGFQLIPSQRQPHGTPVLTRPDGGHYIESKPTIHQPPPVPGQPQRRIEQPQVSPTLIEKVPTHPTTGTSQGLPGVSEPDRSNCCKALRDLKRRCCDRPIQRNGASSCCKSSGDDMFDFSSDDDLDETKEPCKVVKAICYIVYKPVGKARVCKPTTTNEC